MPDYAALVADLAQVCKAEGEKALAIRAGMKREIKPDGSIVTDADRVIEANLREWIRRVTPDAPVWGEEFGYAPPNEHGLWMLDPVDGTSNFAYGQALWGVTAAYFHGGQIQLGVVRIPESDWTLAAIAGHGAFLNGSRLPNVRRGAIEPFELVGVGSKTFKTGEVKVGKVRHIGSFVYETALFLQGGLRALIADGVRMYDAAAGVVLSREIGAEVLDMGGNPLCEADWLRDVRCRTFGFFPPQSNWPFEKG